MGRFQLIDPETGQVLVKEAIASSREQLRAGIARTFPGQRVQAIDLESGPDSAVARGFGAGVQDLNRLLVSPLLSAAEHVPGRIGNLAKSVRPTIAGQAQIDADFARRQEDNPLLFGAARGIASGAPTIPLGVGGGAIAKSALIEVLSSAGGGAAAEAAEASGAGTGAQVASGLAGGLLPSVATGISRVASSGLREVLTESGQAASAQRTAAEVLRREAGSRWDEVVSEVAAQADPPAGIPLTPGQAAGGVTPRMINVEESVFRQVGGEPFDRIARLRDQSMEQAAMVLSGVFPSGRSDDFVSAFRAARDRAWTSVRKAYQDTKGSPVPVRTNRLKRTARFVTEDAGQELAKSLPRGVVRLIGGYGDTISFTQLEKLRSRLTNEIHQQTKRQGGDRQTVRFLSKLLDSTEKTLDDIVSRGGGSGARATALRRAVAQRAKLGSAFENDFARVLEDFEDPARWFESKVLRSKTPRKGIRILRESILDSDIPDSEKAKAIAGLQQLGQDSIFGPDFFSDITVSGVKKALVSLRRNGAVYEELFGPDSVEAARFALERTRRALAGVVGTSAFASRQGSSRVSLQKAKDALSILAATARGDLQSMVQIGLSRAMRRAVGSDEVAEVLARMFSDRAFFLEVANSIGPEMSQSAASRILGGNSVAGVVTRELARAQTRPEPRQSVAAGGVR